MKAPHRSASASASSGKAREVDRRSTATRPEVERGEWILGDRCPDPVGGRRATRQGGMGFVLRCPRARRHRRRDEDHAAALAREASWMQRSCGARLLATSGTRHRRGESTTNARRWKRRSRNGRSPRRDPSRGAGRSRRRVAVKARTVYRHSSASLAKGLAVRSAITRNGVPSASVS